MVRNTLTQKLLNAEKKLRTLEDDYKFQDNNYIKELGRLKVDVIFFLLNKNSKR